MQENDEFNIYHLYGYEKWEINMDVSKGVIYVGEENIVKIYRQENQLKLEWAKDWEEWTEFQNVPKFMELVKRANDLLGKANGKGKKGAYKETEQEH